MLIIHPLTIIYLVLGLYFNRVHGIVFLYLFGLIHELSHVVVARIFKVKTKEIVLLPTGFKANLEDFSQISIFKQILIIIAGPLSYFISFLVIKIFFHFNLISIYGMRMCNTYNMLILIFNIIPIYPLDGGKLIDIFLANFVSEFKCRIIRMIISLFVSIILVFYIKTLGDLMIIGFILSSFVISLINLKKDYKLFLIKRKFLDNNFKIKLNKKVELFRFKNNYLFRQKKFLSEKEIIDEILKE